MPSDSIDRRRWLSRLALGTLAIVATTTAAPAQAVAPAPAPAKTQAPPEKATEPAPRPGSWMKQHEKFLELARKGNIDLLFLGDSITAGWAGGGKDVWQRHYASRNAANFGIGGDRTQHVLWRIENGEVEGIKPRVVVLMIGTNNSANNSADEIADGIKLIVRRLRDKLPETKVLLLGVFPRDEKENAKRVKLTEVNEKIASLGDGKMISYLDIGKNFLNDDGSISREIMPDLLHLSPKGYAIWADAIEPTLRKLLDEEKSGNGEAK